MGVVSLEANAVKVAEGAPAYLSDARQTTVGKVVTGLTLISALIFFLATVIGFYAADIQYEYSTILTPAFIGFGGLYTGLVFYFWKKKEETRGIKSVTIVAITGCILAFGGFTSFLAFAASYGEEVSSFVVLLWIPLGSGVALLAFESRKKIEAKTKELSTTRSRLACIGYWSCNVFTLFVMGFFQVLILAFMAQAVLAANGYRTSPLGTIYSIKAMDGRTLNMHLACTGTASASNVTWIFEHGGGANSIALKGLADTIASAAGARTCVYDRLGYGWTPSFVTLESNLKYVSTGELLQLLLSEAGESGPFNCVGHSAGANACLDFATVESQVVGIGMLDGYPDIIRAGSFRPGNYSGSSTIAGLTGLVGLIAGPTGILRGRVGNTEEGFEPEALEDDFSDLYAQSRFWFSQYWDVIADLGAGEAGATYLKTGGAVRNDSLVDYGNNLNLQVVVIPANQTVTRLDCDLEENEDEHCCGFQIDYQICSNEEADRGFYLNQAVLYTQTIGTTPGVMEVAPRGSAHNFVYQREFIPFISATLINNLPS